MTKFIGIVVIVLFLFGVYHIVMYYDKIQNEKESDAKQAAATRVDGYSLRGMPTPQLEKSLRAAEQQGAAGLGRWLKAYGADVEDPRKAWIELDYCVLVARDSPAEAKRIFAEVKARTAPSSPLWPRIKELSKTYE
jgi:type II secretory pathway pseudopilin PulG